MFSRSSFRCCCRLALYCSHMRVANLPLESSKGKVDRLKSWNAPSKGHFGRGNPGQAGMIVLTGDPFCDMSINNALLHLV